jgi:Lrp/AsnC family transcriptional regulator, regulator for asnA, asnC and gidA
LHINPKFWGYKFTADIRIETALKDEKEVMETLANKRYILGAGNFGTHIMGLIILSKLDQLRSIIEDVETDPKARHVEALIWAEAQDIYHPENLIIQSFNNSNIKETKKSPAKSEEILLDEIDKQIINLLVFNSRTPFISIARQLSISTQNVIQRYKKLKENNIIMRSSICIDLTKLGYYAMYNNFFRLEPKSKISEIRKKLLQMPNAILLIEHVGTYDLRVDFPIKSIEDIFLILEQIRKIEGVEKVYSTLSKFSPMLFPAHLYNKIVST